MSTSGKKKAASTQFNARLPQMSHDQIADLVEAHGLTKTQVIIVAVDRLWRDLKAEAADANRDIHRLKTVARIVPDIDLGHDG